MGIPTEPIGSIPRPTELIAAIEVKGNEDPSLEAAYEFAVRDTVRRFEATGSPVITDGEQRKFHNFWTYSVHALPNTIPDGFQIPFAAGHIRRMPRLTSGPFRYRRYADAYLRAARQYAHVPMKQAVISVSALSLMYPADGIADYSRDQFVEDLLNEHETEIRRCLKAGAHLEAANYIPLEQLGTTDDCGFAPFSDDTSTSRDTAFAKIHARVKGTALAEESLGLR